MNQNAPDHYYPFTCYAEEWNHLYRVALKILKGYGVTGGSLFREDCAKEIAWLAAFGDYPLNPCDQCGHREIPNQTPYYTYCEGHGKSFCSATCLAEFEEENEI